MLSCERRSKGFKRRSNLRDHCLRLHNLDMPLQQLVEEPKSMGADHQSMLEDASDHNGFWSEFLERSPGHHAFDTGQHAVTTDSEALWNRISAMERESKEVHAKIDSRINSLEKLVAVLKGPESSCQRGCDRRN